MHVRPIVFFVVFTICLSACENDTGNYQAILPSPDFDVHIYFQLYNGYPYYMAYYREQRIFDWSAMGFKPENGIFLDREMNRLDNEEWPGKMPPAIDTNSFFSGRKYNQLLVHLQSSAEEKSGYTVEFRTFKDGLAFRYVLLPGMDPDDTFPFEITEFALTHQKIFRIPEESDPPVEEIVQKLSPPVQFVSENNEKIEIFELPGKTSFDMQLVKKEGKEQVYRSSVADTGNTGINPGEISATPWRIVRIETSRGSLK